MCSLLKKTFVLVLVSSASASSKSKLQRKYPAATITAPTDSEVSSSESKPKPVHLSDSQKAWKAARTIKNRSPDVWRLDRDGNVIIAETLSRQSIISYAPHIETSGIMRDEPQAVHNGVCDSLPYVPQVEHLMNLVEIALVGYISDGLEPLCWTPSEIHHGLLSSPPETAAEEWRNNCCSRDGIFGRYGHESIFGEMEVKLQSFGPPLRFGKERYKNIPRCSRYVSNFVAPVPEAAAEIVNEAVEEEEGKTDCAESTVCTKTKELLDSDISYFSGLTDEEFSKKSKELEDWNVVTPSRSKGKTNSGSSSAVIFGKPSASLLKINEEIETGTSSSSTSSTQKKFSPLTRSYGNPSASASGMAKAGGEPFIKKQVASTTPLNAPNAFINRNVVDQKAKGKGPSTLKPKFPLTK